MEKKSKKKSASLDLSAGKEVSIKELTGEL